VAPTIGRATNQQRFGGWQDSAAGHIEPLSGDKIAARYLSPALQFFRLSYIQVSAPACAQSKRGADRFRKAAGAIIAAPVQSRRFEERL